MSNGSSTAVGAPNHGGGGFLARLRPALAPRKISGVYLWIALIIFYSLATSTFFSGTTARTIATEQAIQLDELIQKLREEMKEETNQENIPILLHKYQKLKEVEKETLEFLGTVISK